MLLETDIQQAAKTFDVQPAPHPTRIMVALSGGVDSSVAAWLLQQAGHEVIGVSLRLAPDAPAGTRRQGRCCSNDDMTDARQVCDKLGIAFYAIDARDLFHKQVFSPFVQAYKAGLTPSPCLACNHVVKFGSLHRTALSLNAQLATGHYAQRVQYKKHLTLARPVDQQRDQTYYLYGTPKQALESLQLPLGKLHKPLVRALAQRAGLGRVHNKPDSQEICFVPDGNHARVIENASGSLPTGDVVHINGKKLGQHAGIHHFTVGQRRGTRVSVGQRSYVVDVDPQNNRVTMGCKQALACGKVRVGQLNALVPTSQWPSRVNVQIRARHQPQQAHWEVNKKGQLQLQFEQPAFAVALGQAAVVYDGDVLLGGGILCARLDTAIPREVELTHEDAGMG
ncbi:MAG: tRNA 2-thiouridine(34) synthase MnmA [Myxococcota bacterium]